MTPRIYWLTGLSGAGKSSIAEATVRHLRSGDIPVLHLDGDVLRQGLCADLGFTEADRSENIRRAASLAQIAQSQGILTICSLISPLRSHRELARTLGGAAFREVFIDCPLEECIRRDPKGLYSRALSGQLPNFTGVSAPYEPPITPDFRLPTAEVPLARCVEQLREFMAR